ncbi:MAG: hydroxyacylglutathione hydrolase family protein [Thermoproteota archaeon]
MKNFSYLLSNGKTGVATIIDPGFDVDRILNKASTMKLRVEFVFNTHSHFDHCSGNEEIKRFTNAKIIAHESSPIYKDIAVVDGSKLRLGGLEALAIHTPGHSKDSMCLLIEKKLFTGDTLFVGECGRIDLEGGDPSEMYDSLFRKILALPDDTEVYPGHDYGEKPYSSIGYERRNNYVLKPRTKEQFIELMSEP